MSAIVPFAAPARWREAGLLFQIGTGIRIDLRTQRDLDDLWGLPSHVIFLPADRQNSRKDAIGPGSPGQVAAVSRIPVVRVAIPRPAGRPAGRARPSGHVLLAGNACVGKGGLASLPRGELQGFAVCREAVIGLRLMVSIQPGRVCRRTCGSAAFTVPPPWPAANLVTPSRPNQDKATSVVPPARRSVAMLGFEDR
jgi:hypothetical protein